MWYVVCALIIFGIAVSITWLYFTNRSIVLEEFTGMVDSINDGKAYVTLIPEDGGEELEGEYPAKELENLGIKLYSRFLCKTILVGRKTEVVFEYLPIVSIKKSLQ